jgi:alpha-D-ribose 1-methylphosphonate 5-triphosphate synthase subunit PhnH
MTSAASAPILTGFSDNSRQSNEIFRTVMNALSHPGRVFDLTSEIACPTALNRAATAVVMALADYETPIWLAPNVASDQATAHFNFHTGCTVSATAADALFAIANTTSDLSFLESLAVGTSENPHQSATLILMIDGFADAEGLKLSGPGIKDLAYVNPQRLPDDVISLITQNEKLFPLGIDLLLASDDQLVGIPRSTKLEI